MSKSHPAGSNAGRARDLNRQARKTHPSLRSQTRKPQVPVRLRAMYEDEDSFDIPDIALGGGKD
ncbi:MAG: hypothetical protein AB7E79_09430 [Rhodospirillaceae bacterium]